MSIGTFTERNQRPKDSEVVEALGSSHARWLALVGHLRTTFGAREDVAFLYGKGYGWALRFRLKGKLLASLFPGRGHFTVQINLSRSQLSQTGALHLHEKAAAAIDAANLYAEGKWIFAPVHNQSDVKDVLRLLGLKTGKMPA